MTDLAETHPAGTPTPSEQRFERLFTRWVMTCACVAPALAVLSGSF